MHAPIKQVDPATGLMVKVPLENYESTYQHGLPQGSWERLRQSFDMLQGDTTIGGAGSLEIIDTSQNDNNLVIYGTAAATNCLRVQEMTYNLSATDFDFNSASNKVRIRSFQSKTKAKQEDVKHGRIVRIPTQVGVDLSLIHI
mgnify:FL=1